MQGETVGQFQINLERVIEDRLGGESAMRRDVFLRWVVEYLVEDGTLEDLHVCYCHAQYRNSRLEVGGYAFSDDGRVLDLVLPAYGNGGETIGKDQVDKRFRWATNFAQACRDGHHLRMEESTPEYDMVQLINARWSEIAKIRIILVTDGRSTVKELPEGKVDGIPVSYDLWDIERLRRLATSESRSEPITVDFQQLGQPLLCLPALDTGSEYRCFLTVIPGRLLADIYEEHGSKLLQRNVRAFLQLRGKVNKGINGTIKDSPDLFLAYNNGISATATEVELVHTEGGVYIKALQDLQIVNGGQTTASLHHAAKRSGLDLSAIQVPAKITVVLPEKLDELVPRISRYANSQNTINEADFEANSPFHRDLENLSRSVWAPASSGQTQQSRWYYERVRGQYQVDRARCRTPALRRAFDKENPSKRRFSKTDAAKYELTFLQKPHVVSLGGQKTFQRWTVEVIAERDEPIGAEYFRDLVAKQIFFEQARSEIMKLSPSAGYLANVTTYTLARLSTELDLPKVLKEIWRQQDLPGELRDAVRNLCFPVREVLQSPPGGANVTEWCKKEACWEAVKKVMWAGPTL